MKISEVCFETKFFQVVVEVPFKVLGTVSKMVFELNDLKEPAIMFYMF